MDRDKIKDIAKFETERVLNTWGEKIVERVSSDLTKHGKKLMDENYCKHERALIRIETSLVVVFVWLLAGTLISFIL